MSVSEEVPTQWHPYFEARGFDSFHDVAKVSKVAVSTVIACLRPGGREPKDATVIKVATALGIPVSKLRELRGEPDVEPFTLPSKADQLDPVERRAVLTVVDALLRARGDDSADTPDSGSSTQSDAPDEAQQAQEVKRFIVLRYDPARPGDGVVQGPTIEAIDESDASEQLYRSLELAGVAVDPASDPLTTIARHGTATTLIRIVRDDAQYLERQEHAAAKLRERGAQLREGPAAELSQLLGAVDPSSMETETVSDLLNLLQASLRNRRSHSEANSRSDRDLPGTDTTGNNPETGSNTTGSGGTVPSDAVAAKMSDIELKQAADADPLWADYVKTKRPELVDWDF